MFGYTCTNCGPKGTFDWMGQCVVKVGPLHLKGTYDAYGRVEIEVQGRKKPAIAMPKQNHWMLYQEGPDVLLATDIYCNGDEANEDENGIIPMNVMRDIANQQASTLMAFVNSGGLGGGYAEPDSNKLRFCVPDKVKVLDGLTEDLLAKLPTKGTVYYAKSDAAKKKSKADKISKGDEQDGVTPKKKVAKKSASVSAMKKSTSSGKVACSWPSYVGDGIAGARAVRPHHAPASAEERLI